VSELAPAQEADAGPEDTGPTPVFGHPTTLSRGQLCVHPDRDSYAALVRALRDDGYQMCVDLTAVDYLGHPGRALPPGVQAERFEVVVNLLSYTPARRLRVRVQVPEPDPRIASLYEIHPAVDTQERETYDMFGIVFEGHPDLSRILMPDDWEGHPLRKDYGIGRIPVQFKGAPPPR